MLMNYYYCCCCSYNEIQSEMIMIRWEGDKNYIYNFDRYISNDDNINYEHHLYCYHCIALKLQRTINNDDDDDDDTCDQKQVTVKEFFHQTC